MITKYFIGVIIICLISIIGGIINAQYINDGYHWGFIFSHSVDLLKGKEPFVEIFLEYGFLQGLINFLLIKIFGEHVFIIQVFIIIIYSISLFLIYKIIFQLTNNDKLSFLSVLIIFVLYPWPTSPWPIFFSFFFSMMFILFYLEEERKYSILAGISLFCAYLSYTTLYNFIIIFFILSIILQFFLFSNQHTKKYKKHLYYVFSTFFLFIFIFITYLVLNDFLLNWVEFQKIPFLVKDSLKFSYFDIIFQYMNFLFVMPFINLVNEPQWLIYSILFTSNFLAIIFIIKKKRLFLNNHNKLKFLTIAIYIILLNFFGQVQTLMYLSCSISAAVICFAILFNNIKSNENKFIVSTIIFFLTFYSLFNYEMKFSKHADSRDKSIKFISSSKIFVTGNVNYYKYFKWDEEYWKLLDTITNKIKLINKKCKNINGVNLTDDVYLYLLIDNKTFQRLPFYLDGSSFKFNKIFDENLNNNIQEQIFKENIFIISQKNNEKNLVFNNKYVFFDTTLKSDKIISDIFRIIYPKKCD